MIKDYTFCILIIMATQVMAGGGPEDMPPYVQLEPIEQQTAQERIQDALQQRPLGADEGYVWQNMGIEDQERPDPEWTEADAVPETHTGDIEIKIGVHKESLRWIITVVVVPILVAIIPAYILMKGRKKTKTVPVD